jgi:hypothetical protein
MLNDYFEPCYLKFVALIIAQHRTVIL